MGEEVGGVRECPLSLYYQRKKRTRTRMGGLVVRGKSGRNVDELCTKDGCIFLNRFNCSDGVGKEG